MRYWLIVAVCATAVFFGVVYIPGAGDLLSRFGPPIAHSSPVTLVLGILLAPGWLVVGSLSRLILGQSYALMDIERFPILAPVFTVFIIGFSWAFWSITISRSLKLIGLWNPFGPKIMGRRPVVLRALVAIGGWWEILSKFGRQATGGWASLLEVMSCRFKDGDIFLGRPRFRIGGGMLRPIGIPTEKHMVTIAQSGAGKSTGALIPNLCIHRGSLLCVDPKGELARITASRRGQGGNGVSGLGQDVHVLDPFHITGITSACYNAFDEMAAIGAVDVDAPVSYAGKIAEALVEISGRDPYWDTAARRVIAGLILYVFQGPKEHRNLVRVRRLLMEGDVEAFNAGVEAGDIDPRKNTPFDALLIFMKNCPPGPYRDSIAFTAGSLLQMGQNQLGSVLSVAQEHTAFLDIPEIKRVSMSSDFLLAELKERPVSVYLSVPINMVSGVAGRWLRMFVLLLIDMMMRVQKAPKPPILLAIDEFPSLGKLEGIETVAPVMRSYGVRLWIVGQGIEQFRKVYPDSTDDFIGNAEAVQFMGVKDLKTVKMVVEFLGRHVVRGREGEGQFRRTVETERNLLDANQVSQILYKERKNQIVWRGDRRPLILKLTPYFEYMPFWYYAPDGRYPEAWNRRLWRGGKPAPVLPPQAPPDLPPGPPPRFLPPEPPDRSKPPRPPSPIWDDSKRPKIWDQFLLNKDEDEEDDGKPLPSYDNPASWRQISREESNRILEKYVSKPLKLPGPPESLIPRVPPPTKPPSPRATELPPEVVNILNPPSRPSLDPLEELNAMIGLDAVKEQVNKTINLIKLGKARDAAGMPRLDLTHHLVFTGNPGTGKTTVARIIGKIYKKMGLLRRGHLVETDRSGLVAGYTGQTAIKVQEVVEGALDGVLFIDEAYNLVPTDKGNDNYGAEAVATLLKLMEDKRGRLVVIAAGYREEMARFINSNPGLQSRFRTTIDFPDYSPLELMEILQSLCSAAGCSMSMDAMRKAAQVMLQMDHGKGFGNGRAVRSLFQDCMVRQALRLNERGAYGPVDLKIIEASDIPEDAVG
jgi:stage V sporulation protein K